MEKIHHTVLTRLATIILLLASTLTLASCLNETPKDQIDEDEAYGTASKLLLNAVGSLYNYIGGNADSQGLQGTYRGVYDYNTFTTDEAMIPTRGGDWYDGGFLAGTLQTPVDTFRQRTLQHLELPVQGRSKVQSVAGDNRSAPLTSYRLTIRGSRGRNPRPESHVLFLYNGHVRQRAAGYNNKTDSR